MRTAGDGRGHADACQRRSQSSHRIAFYISPRRGALKRMAGDWRR
jgi:hypothetical protein